MRKELFFGAALALSFASFSALAFQGSSSSDTSGDAQSVFVTYEQGTFGKYLSSLDKNGDGYISADELKDDHVALLGTVGIPPSVGAPGETATSRAESGAISFGTYLSGLDKNGDGYISADELKDDHSGALNSAGIPASMGLAGGTTGPARSSRSTSHS